MCSISIAATPAPASASETAGPPASGGLSLRAASSAPATRIATRRSASAAWRRSRSRLPKITHSEKSTASGARAPQPTQPAACTGASATMRLPCHSPAIRKASASTVPAGRRPAAAASTGSASSMTRPPGTYNRKVLVKHRAEIDQHGGGAGGVKQRHRRLPVERDEQHRDEQHRAADRAARRLKLRPGEEPDCRSRHEHGRNDGRPVDSGGQQRGAGVPAAQPDHGERGQQRRIDEHHDREAGARLAGDQIDQLPASDAGKARGGEQRPAAQPRDRRVGDQHDGEIAEQRPGARRLRGDEGRRHHRAEQANSRQRLTVDERQRDRADADHTQEGECQAGADEAIDAVRGIDGAEQRECPGGSQNARHVGAGDPLDRHPVAGAPDELAPRQPEPARAGPPWPAGRPARIFRLRSNSGRGRGRPAPAPGRRPKRPIACRAPSRCRAACAAPARRFRKAAPARRPGSRGRQLRARLRPGGAAVSGSGSLSSAAAAGSAGRLRAASATIGTASTRLRRMPPPRRRPARAPAALRAARRSPAPAGRAAPAAGGAARKARRSRLSRPGHQASVSPTPSRNTHLARAVSVQPRGAPSIMRRSRRCRWPARHSGASALPGRPAGTAARRCRAARRHGARESSRSAGKQPPDRRRRRAAPRRAA